MRKIAVSHLILPGGEMLKNQVLRFQEGQLISWSALIEEEAFVIWAGGKYDMRYTPSENAAMLGIKIE